MRKMPLDQDLHDLDTQVIQLGSLVDKALAQALEALATGDQDKADAVVQGDRAIDDLHLAIEQHSLEVLWMQEPLSRRNLRYLVSVVPISVDLERIGDDAEGIALRVLRMLPLGYAGQSSVGAQLRQAQEESNSTSPTAEGDAFSESSTLQGLLNFGQQVRSMLQQTMKAFVDRDVEAARSIWDEDPTVDTRSYILQRDLMALLEDIHAIPALKHDAHLLQRAAYLEWITHNLERVADHCTNICERIIYIVQDETEVHPSLDEED